MMDLRDGTALLEVVQGEEQGEARKDTPSLVAM
jgi:hypothetical protein